MTTTKKIRREKEKKFYEMNLAQRLNHLKALTNISQHDIEILRNPTSFTFVNANRMVENAIGVFSIPLGIATNFVINKKKYLVPMAIEEPSVIAGLAKLPRLPRIMEALQRNVKNR